MTFTELQQSARALSGQTTLVWGIIPSSSSAPAPVQALQPLRHPRSQQHSPGPGPCSCTWPRRSCSCRCIPASASCSHTACSHSGPCMSTAEGRGIQWPGCSWNAPAPASCGISKAGTPLSCPRSVSLPVLPPRIILFLISRIKSFRLQIHLQDL